MLGRFLSAQFKQQLAEREDARTVALNWADKDDKAFVCSNRLLENHWSSKPLKLKGKKEIAFIPFNNQLGHHLIEMRGGAPETLF